MPVTRRDLMKASAIIAGALGLTGAGILRVQESLAKNGGLPVLWFQGQGCTGCSVSLLNSIYYTTIDDLLLNTLDLKYHPNLSAAAGQKAIAAAEAAYSTGGYVLVMEGAIPTADSGRAAWLWPGTTVLNGIKRYAIRASYLVAVGSCASYGGLSAGAPNPTGAKSLAAVTGKAVVNIPGCPVHPDWVVGSIAYILTNGRAPALDSSGRPKDYFGATAHSKCPNRNSYTGPNHHSHGQPCTNCHGRGKEEDAISASRVPAFTLSAAGCLYPLGCKGVSTYCDCGTRKWNGAAANTPGVNWCIGARSPCIGCTQPNFPDGMSPFFTAQASAVTTGTTGGTTGGSTGGGHEEDDD